MIPYFLFLQTPGPPELYHSGGVTYYSTQNQMQRPHIMVPTKHPKPMDSSKRDLRSSLRHHQNEAEMYHHYRDDSRADQAEADPQPVIEVSAGEAMNYASGPAGHRSESDDLTQKFEDAVTLQPSLERYVIFLGEFRCRVIS